MTWDVFISYASEDKPFARRLASGLESAGLRVWFDEAALEAGDSLRRSIDKGLKDSRYGVVVLSTNFFRKEWPQRELDGLTAREDGNSKVVIPVWYRISVDDVRKYSPVLADKLSIYSRGSVAGVVAKVLRAIEKDRIDASGWSPVFTQLAGGPELTILPVRPWDNRAICIGRYPVLNREYRIFVDNAPYRAPVGENYRDDEWIGPFLPWENVQFSNSEQPVVCVTFGDAVSYCNWLAGNDHNVFVPPAALWDFAAAGRISALSNVPGVNPDLSTVHHRSSSPAVVDRAASRLLKK